MLLRLLILLALGYAGFCLLVFLMQRRMLYFPSRQTPADALQEARSRNLEPWKDESGRILGWKAAHPSGAPQGTLLVLHGNAGSALDRTYYREVFQAPDMPLALDVILLEFPGYGPRDGAPTEATLVRAALEAIDRLKRESSRPLLVAGESLGSATAALAVAERPQAVTGLILFVPIKNVPAIAKRHYPVIPSFLVRDTFRADRALVRLRMPVTFLLAGQDEVVFADLGRELFDAYPGPKRLWVDEWAPHNGVDFTPGLKRWADMVAFSNPK